MMKKSTFFLSVALFCGSMTTVFAQDNEVKVTPAIDKNTGHSTFTFKKDYKYYGFLLDDETKAANLADDQYVYIGADAAAGRNLYIWDGQSSFVKPDGTNSFGIPGGYLAYKVGGAGWSGLGYNIAKAYPIDLSGIGDDYTFHMAVMSTSNEPFDFYLTDGAKHEAHIILSDKKAFEKDPVCNFTRNGEWYNIDIPMTYLEDNFGLSFKKDNKYADKNLLCILAGGKAGTILNYDAVFFYGPKVSTGISDVINENNDAPVEYYSISGKKVNLSYAKAHKGVYLMKQGKKTQKVIIG